MKYVRSRIAELGDRMIDGDISVAPARLGTWVPCNFCEYRSVCRFDYQTDHPRRLEHLSRSEAFKRMSEAQS
jgi:ATP-dependent helicase/nuclease subunit B